MNRSPPYQLKAIDPAGGFAGYASVFDLCDAQGDRVSKGAFAADLDRWRASGRRPPLLWQHDPADPIGCFDRLREDDHGLWVEGRLSLDTPQGGNAYRLLKMGAVDGLSIGYQPIIADHDRDGSRRLQQVTLHEISLVTMPANDASRIAWVKQQAIDADLPLARIAADLRRAAAALRR